MPSAPTRLPTATGGAAFPWWVGASTSVRCPKRRSGTSMRSASATPRPCGGTSSGMRPPRSCGPCIRRRYRSRGRISPSPGGNSFAPGITSTPTPSAPAGAARSSASSVTTPAPTWTTRSSTARWPTSSPRSRPYPPGTSCSSTTTSSATPPGPGSSSGPSKPKNSLSSGTRR